MYSRKRAKLPDNITLDWILSKVTEYDIYAKYIGQFKVGMIYNSPFRKDKNPSFGIYYSKRTKQLLFKDHGTGECGNVIKFVSLFTGKTEYNDILSDIVDKLNITNNTKLVSSKQYIPPTETVIGVVRQEFTDVDINYWKQFNISINTLKKFNVNSIKYYLCNGIVKGNPAVSPSSESTFLPKDVLEQLKTRFKRIIILFDRDVAGVKRSRKLSRETGLEAIFINKKFKAKDVSDAVKANSFEEIKNWLNETIKNYR